MPIALMALAPSEMFVWSILALSLASRLVARTGAAIETEVSPADLASMFERIRAEWVVTLLALLELVRLGQVRARQAEPFGEITIEKNALSVSEPARAAMPDDRGPDGERANE